MKVYTADTNKGRTVGSDDIHHRTSDTGRVYGAASAKAQRASARQKSKRDISSEVEELAGYVKAVVFGVDDTTSSEVKEFANFVKLVQEVSTVFKPAVCSSCNLNFCTDANDVYCDSLMDCPRCGENSYRSVNTNSELFVNGEVGVLREGMTLPDSYTLA